ncbi:MAG: prolyl oligopeptidase family serine peptidase [Limnospira sp. PMC 1291.21]|uniref:prolyl oligopeptidase family serine peptidase n=1 Tax=unclassified Limnospira TaxID=2642885 RepID=UPI0028E15A1A|nr:MULTISPECIES: prolyl oligopeptidase family serine peptidase [unclassified Limnospira]MDT9176221.1 prolyl oligopeptidase family serine peptidase [Limnospira sp. PMC 1238.20]MDT9191525.1 prolyl oligopeptidase family serine peptidase [Limnospira sp. PMC 1245.20]MDT9201780.1 prolyl oligopeptidase family serine peptidase [Limnospira sp. PMC 1243.20]MDT9207070.1 prolyl oligopeptidase family serine peptidase [Limnospira sp. PMC 1252.20]MDT9212136.1 prolyl oligopeptidase family serine peptidase [Li
MSDLNQPLIYPHTRQSDQVDEYHGIQVTDPYRWLEDLDSDETKAWVTAQNQVTFDYLSTIPSRQKLSDRLTQLWNYERYSIPFREGQRYFYFKNDGLQNQSVLYVMDSWEGEPRVLLDPNQLSEDGTVALSGIAISEDGNLIAYGLSASGSDWQEWKVMDINTVKPLEDHLKWIKFSGASWTHDHQGFFYSRYDEPNEETQFEDINYYQKLFYHRLGTPQSEDVLIYQRPDQKEWGFNGFVTEDGQYLIISVWRGTDPKNLVFYRDLTKPDSPVVELISEFEAEYSFIDNQGETFWFKTDLDAPMGRVIAININTGNRYQIIPEAIETLEGVSTLNNQFVALYLKDARSQVNIFHLDGTLVREVELPGIGSVGGFDGKREDTETFYSFTSFTTPPTIYKYNIVTGESQLYRQPTVDFNPEDYQTNQVFYSSPDGAMVPMFITHKKGLKLDGNNPTILYGYGGFSISLTPNFSVSRLVWMEMGGLYAVANLRGGGEYGQQWHQAGMKLKKQNVFDDFIAAAEWLIHHNYTQVNKLAISGGSNGGLLVGACMTQRPELFGAALPAVAVMDMLRFHKFTIGWAWTSEYGSPENEEEFQVLYRYSPLHNLQPGTAYPATLITTGDHDDRVVPAHSFKFISALQAAHSGDNPVLIRIETKAGHGAGKPMAKIIEEIADQFAFLVRVLDIN